MYELLCGCITSQLVVGPTGNIRAAEVYAAKARSRQLHVPTERLRVSMFFTNHSAAVQHAEPLLPCGWTTTIIWPRSPMGEIPHKHKGFCDDEDPGM